MENGKKGFFDRLMGTHWFPETCELFFRGEHRRRYDETISGLLARGILSKDTHGTVIRFATSATASTFWWCVGSSNQVGVNSARRSPTPASC